MKRIQFLALLILIIIVIPGLAANNKSLRLVLVTNSTTGVKSLSTNEIHKLFLGLPIEKSGRSLEAAINRSDPFLYEIFLQKIVYMSSISYERHLLSNVIQLGGQRPRIFDNTQSLISDLEHKPGTVSVLWDSDLKSTTNLTVIGDVWHGTKE
jgi:hypothetical protein